MAGRRYYDDDNSYHRDSHRRSHNSGHESRFASDYSPPKWSWISTVLSVVSMTVFASWFGIIGLLFSGLSYVDHKVGDYSRARNKRWWSLCCSITGIIFTTVAIVMLFVVMFAIDVEKPTFKHYDYWIPPWLLDNLENRTTSARK